MTVDFRIIGGESEIVWEIDEISIPQLLGRRLFLELNKGISASLSSHFLDWSDFSIAWSYQIPDIHLFPNVIYAHDGKNLHIKTNEETTALDIREAIRHLLSQIENTSAQPSHKEN